MYRGCIVEKWNHTSVLLALQANCHRDPKKRRRPYSARDFHPFPPPRPKLTATQKKANFDAIRDAFKYGTKGIKTRKLSPQKVIRL